ncbi:cytidine deaminase [Pseudoflavonifractor sp. 524-17]|uniref:cytidine deaminase n=1 Tax=Pseudoflavonifractor sp. 524-17 TaxID=2304577 RepID=UPI00325AD00A
MRSFPSSSPLPLGARRLPGALCRSGIPFVEFLPFFPVSPLILTNVSSAARIDVAPPRRFRPSVHRALRTWTPCCQTTHPYPKEDHLMTDQELVERAFTMLQYSYVPYSHFPVGAALMCADGTVFTGCNVENSAFGSTICAERTALVKAVSEGHRDDFVRIAVVGNSADYCWPCGACRQMLYEFAPELIVLVARADHSFVRYPLHELLAHGFGPKSLAQG